MIRYFKALKNLRHSESQELLRAGTYFSDEGSVYNPDIETKAIVLGKAEPRKPAPKPILFRPGFYAGRPETVINFLLLAGAIDVVEKEELIKLGVLSKPSPKKTTKKVKDKDDGEV